MAIIDSGKGSALTALAPLGRRDFVDQTVSRFEHERRGVPTALKGYILEHVLVGDQEWDAGLKERKFDQDQVAKILFESLEKATSEIEWDRGDADLDFQATEAVFDEVVMRWRCPYPFRRC